MLRLDVRDDKSVAACLWAVMEQAGRIDALVNNAGVSISGAVEEASIEEVQTLFETNFFGVVRMTNAVLPIMRGQRSGRIINLSSLAGLVGVPYLGLYAASKHAIEGYSASLRQEVKAFGVHVSVVEPGDVRTMIGRQAAVPGQRIPDYDGVRERANAIHEGNVDKGPEPEVVARAILRILESRSPRLRYPVTHGTEFFVPLMRRFFPEWLAERVMRVAYRLDG